MLLSLHFNCSIFTTVYIYIKDINIIGVNTQFLSILCDQVKEHSSILTLERIYGWLVIVQAKAVWTFAFLFHIKCKSLSIDRLCETIFSSVTVTAKKKTSMMYWFLTIPFETRQMARITRIKKNVACHNYVIRRCYLRDLWVYGSCPLHVTLARTQNGRLFLSIWYF